MKTIETTLFKVIGEKGLVDVKNKGVYIFNQREDYPNGYKCITKHGCEILLLKDGFNKITHNSYTKKPSYWISKNGYISCEVYITKNELSNKDKILNNVILQLRNKAKEQFGCW